ncbi:MAG: alpha/beta hydrolase, partial [Stellaceae bacterium]
LYPLQDDSRRLAAALKEAGVPCELEIYDGINHGFIRYGRLIATARRALGDCAAALRRALVTAAAPAA